MPDVKHRSALSGIVLVLFLVLHPGMSEADAIRVGWNPEQVSRGAVVVLRVQCPLALMAAEAVVGQERFPLIHVEGGPYFALVGIDLNHEGPILPVNFSLYPVKGGSPYRIRADLKILETGKETEVQKLSLPTGMVDFSQRRLRQIRQDSATLLDVLDRRTPRRFWKKGFLIPVKGRITTKFGTRRVLNGRPGSPHNGVDIAGRKGTPVRASNGGRVLLVDRFFLSGHTVVVDHGWGISTIYAHLDTTSVYEGEEVKRGQPIGTVGSTGRATGPHLHFGALVRGVKVDPLQLIEATRGF